MEFAWERKDALQIAAILKQHSFVILGVDIWLPTDPGPTIPTPFVYDWTLRRDKPSEAYATDAEEFIRTFKWDDEDHDNKSLEPYFNLTVGPRSS